MSANLQKRFPAIFIATVLLVLLQAMTVLGQSFDYHSGSVSVGPIYPLVGESGISVDNPASWISVGVGGVGAYSSIGVSQNAINDGVSGLRSATIRIGSSYFSVTQTGVDNTYSISTNQFTFAATGSGGVAVNVTSAISGCPAPLQITSGADWLSFFGGGTSGVLEMAHWEPTQIGEVLASKLAAILPTMA
jgi:hypothetical protein